MKRKYKTIVEVSYYVENQGYSHSETASSEVCEDDGLDLTPNAYAERFTAFIEEWIGNEPKEDEYFNFKIENYAEEDDPLFNEPLRTLNLRVFWNEDKKLEINLID